MSRSGGTAKSLSDLHAEMVDRPVKESATAGDGVSWTRNLREYGTKWLRTVVVIQFRNFPTNRSQCRGRHDPE